MNRFALADGPAAGGALCGHEARTALRIPAGVPPVGLRRNDPLTG
ncbi:hypothetical protein [Nocardia salmonicida]